MKISPRCSTHDSVMTFGRYSSHADFQDVHQVVNGNTYWCNECVDAILEQEEREDGLPSDVVDKAKAAYKGISDFVNAHHVLDNDLIADELVRDHKLLQTYVVDLMIHCIGRMATMSNHQVTAQNKDTVEKCRKMVLSIYGS